MLRRVPGRIERGEAERPDVERVAVRGSADARTQLRAGADDVGRAGQRRQLAPARDVVVVEVRLDDVGDPQVALAAASR